MLFRERMYSPVVVLQQESVARDFVLFAVLLGQMCRRPRSIKKKNRRNMVEQYSRSVLFCCAADRHKYEHTTRGIAVYKYHTVPYIYDVVFCTMVCEREDKYKNCSHISLYSRYSILVPIYFTDKTVDSVRQPLQSIKLEALYLRTFGPNVHPELLVRATSLPTPAPAPVE